MESGAFRVRAHEITGGLRRDLAGALAKAGQPSACTEYPCLASTRDAHEGGSDVDRSMSTTSLTWVRVTHAKCDPSRDQSNVSI